MERVRGQHGRVAMAGPEAAELGLDLVRAEARRLEHRCALDQLGHRGPGGRTRRTSLLLEGHLLDPALGDDERESDEVAAGRPARRAAEAAIGRGTAPCDVSQILL